MTLRLTNNGPATESTGSLMATVFRGSTKKIKVIGTPPGCTNPFVFGNGLSCGFLSFGAGQYRDVRFKLRAKGTGSATVTAGFDRVDPYFNAYRPGTYTHMKLTVKSAPKHKRIQKHR